MYSLLGGPDKKVQIEFYASCLGFWVLPEDVAAKSMALKNEGYRIPEVVLCQMVLPMVIRALLKNVELAESA
ncbi:MAG: hypothetical protein U5K79_25685 [Cyclobacteriaceae bacterium]|nr:hypothetical protein [Cyclobacteriaceae bacterium]